MSIREIFAASEDGKHPFLDIIQYNSIRVHFLLKTSDEEWANSIIQEFIHNYLVNNITEDSKKLILLPTKHPRIVDTKEVPSQISIFIQASKSKRTNGKQPTDTNSKISALTSPPQTSRQPYARAPRKVITTSKNKNSNSNNNNNRASSPTL